LNHETDNKPKARGRTVATILAFLLCAGGITAYALRPAVQAEPEEGYRMRLVVPSVSETNGHGRQESAGTQLADNYILKAPMKPGELVVSVLNWDFSANGEGMEDQVVAFRRTPAQDQENPICIAFFSFSESDSQYVRLWDLPTAATVPGTVSLSAIDLLGDRSRTIVLTGMNDSGEHTLSAFSKQPDSDKEQPFEMIADIRMDGSVAVQEVQRTQSYQYGSLQETPFSILATGYDPGSENLLDRLELTYVYDQASGVYTVGGSRHVPGAQIQQNRVREVLSGAPGVFENFLGDLWYHVTEQGTIDRDQFIFFDTAMREITFVGEGNQQVFSWQQSSTTRQGIFIVSQNSMVMTMRRSVSVTLESMDSVYVTVTDERRHRMDIPESWNGTYRRAADRRAVTPASIASAQ
jgi:hypothetical protein